MRLNHQIRTTFQEMNFNLEELLEKYAQREYKYHQLVEHEFSDYSICVPDHLNTMSNCDGYEFIAYESNEYYDYSVAPLTVTVSMQPLKDEIFQTKGDQMTFLKRITQAMSHQFKIQAIEEVTIDGNVAMLVEQKVGVIGTQVHAMLINHHSLMQISVTLRGNFTNARSLTEAIITSFKMNSKPTPQNESILWHVKPYEQMEVEIPLHLKDIVQYVIPTSPTEHQKGAYCFSQRNNKRKNVAFLGCDDLIEMTFCQWGNTFNYLAFLMLEKNSLS